MNKLLSTLILSVGMSLSATAATSLLDSSIVGYSDFASQTADFGTLKDSVSITSDDSNLTLSGITFNGYGANNRDVMSVTMVLDLSKINTPDAYTALFNAKNSSVSWGVGLNTDRKLQGLWNNTSYNGPVVDTPLGTEGFPDHFRSHRRSWHPHLFWRQRYVLFQQRPEIRQPAN